MANPDVSRVLSSVPTGLWIGGGEERPAASTFDVVNPATDEGAAVRRRRIGLRRDRRLDAACAVRESWAATPARERGEILRSVFETIIEKADDIAMLMTLEMGKVVAESLGEVKYGAEFFRWFAEEAVRIGGRYTPRRPAPGASSSPNSPSARAIRSPRGTSRWPWEPARSARRWRRAAP